MNIRGHKRGQRYTL
ncbi:unnamed protein product [Victoria cruziana]